MASRGRGKIVAVKTNFSTKEFMKIISEYDLGEFIYAKPINEGTVQTNFLLKTTQVIFVFRYYENRSRDSVLFEINSIKYLRDRNYPSLIYSGTSMVNLLVFLKTNHMLFLSLLKASI